MELLYDRRDRLADDAAVETAAGAERWREGGGGGGSSASHACIVGATCSTGNPNCLASSAMTPASLPQSFRSLVSTSGVGDFSWVFIALLRGNAAMAQQ